MSVLQATFADRARGTIVLAGVAALAVALGAGSYVVVAIPGVVVMAVALRHVLTADLRTAPAAPLAPPRPALLPSVAAALGLALVVSALLIGLSPLSRLQTVVATLALLPVTTRTLQAYGRPLGTSLAASTLATALAVAAAWVIA